jgi:hypothetical protein
MIEGMVVENIQVTRPRAERYSEEGPPGFSSRAFWKSVAGGEVVEKPLFSKTTEEGEDQE